MGSETASNQNLAIVTDGTKHVAQNSGATDVCLDPATGATSPFKNNIPSTDLAAKKTTRTKIKGHAIMVAPTIIGPPSKGDEAPFVLGAASGQPFNNWVKASGWSRDVKAEGYWIIRTDDPTIQNAQNSTGTMDGSQLDGNETTAADYIKLKCSMRSLLGTSGKKKLWKRSATATELNYIEILTKETIDFVSERFDATDATGNPPIDPACTLEPKHTIWKVKRTGGGVADKEEEKNGKNYTLGTALTEIGGSWTVGATATNGSLKVTGEASGFSGNASAGSSSTTLAEGQTAQGYRKVTESASTSASVDVGAIRAYLRFRSSPCTIRVDALACSGSKTAWVRLFPADPIKASFSMGVETNDSTKVGQNARNEFIDALYERFGKLKGLCNQIANIVGCAGDIEFEFKLFEGFELDFELGYKHCTKTLTTRSRDWRSVEAHVGLAWSLKVGASTLIGFGITVKIPLVQLALTYFTGGAARAVIRVIQKIEEAIGFKLNIVFKASIGVGLAWSFGSDQHDEATFSGTTSIKPELTVALEVALANAEARAGGTLSGTITLGAALPPPTHFMRITSSGTLVFKVWVEGCVKGRILWVGPEYEIGGRKEFEVFNWKMWEGGVNLIQIGARASA
jgi:hypothetical protein